MVLSVVIAVVGACAFSHQGHPVTEKDDVIIISDKGQVIRTPVGDISMIGRNTQGVRVMTVKGEELVVAVEKILESEENE